LFLLALITVVYSTAQDGLFTHYTLENGLSGKHVFAVTQDVNDNIWLATDGGLSQLQGFEFKSFYYPEKTEPVIGFVKNKAASVWGYNSNGEFLRVSETKINKLAFSSSIVQELKSNLVNGVVLDTANVLWVSGIISPAILSLNTITRELSNLTPELPPSTFWMKQIGQEILTGSNQDAPQDEALLVAEIWGKNLEIPLSGKKGFNKSRAIQLDDNSFLFATGSEVVHFTNEKVKERLFTEKNVECIYQDHEGKIWVGLNQGGLWCFPTGNIASRNRVEYLGNNTVSFLFEDSQNDLWIGTLGNGVYTYSSVPTITYSEPNISIGKDTNRIRKQQAIRLEQDPNVLALERVIWDTVPPDVFISTIKINNQDTSLQNLYVLSADNNFLKIGFVGSLPGNPGLFQYRYRMSGVDQEWVYSSLNTVSYTMLPPGQYSFEVSAMSKEGIWSRLPAQVSFIIEPPFYQTTWFRALLAGLVLFMVTTILIFYTRNIKQKEAQKAAVSQRIADLELMALRAQMNPHFLFNTLSSIQHFVSANNTEEALRYLSKFAKLMRVVLDNSKRKEIPINDEIKAITLYLDLEKLRFKNKFGYSIEVGEGLDPSYDEIPSMLIQPYLENAILHGINNKIDSGFINVKLSLEGENILCVIEDDGVGRTKAAELQKKRSKEHKSQGMNITRDRLSIINRVNNQGLSVIVEDINKSENTGTRVKIIVPFKSY
jgi:hypothetical protein